jgi:hypothetical protein
MKKIVTLVVCLAIGTLFAMLLFYLPALAQSQPSSQAQDPGVRAGTVNAGQALATLSASQTQFFSDGQTRFNQVEASDQRPGPHIQLQQLCELPRATFRRRHQPRG